jgi:diguanylate cyclase (GGDEF)-like protein
MNKPSVDQERIILAQKRATSIVERYLAMHENEILHQKINLGTINKLEGYEMLKEFARDPKTGIPRADLLQISLEYEIALSTNNGQPFTIIVFDADHFKDINTELTHLGGDRVLKKIAEIIQHNVRTSDNILWADDTAVIRWGGEEFVVVLTGTDLNGARLVAERIRLAIAEELVGFRPDKKIITISGGVAEWTTPSNLDWQGLLQAADMKLMAAKKQGRNRIIS